MEILSDSCSKTFSSETISSNSSCDLSKSNGTVTSLYTREDIASLESASFSSENIDSEATSLYSTSSYSETWTTSHFTSANSRVASQESISPEADFLRRCHQTLQNVSQGKSMKPINPVSPSLRSNSPQMDFCHRCIRMLNSASAEKMGDKLGPVADDSKPERAQYINPAIIDRLKLERLIHTMKEVTSLPDRDILQHCQICRKMQRDIHERSFIQDKVRHLKNKLTEEKYQKYLTEMDSISQIGTLAANLPKTSDPPEEIWNKLMKR